MCDKAITIPRLGDQGQEKTMTNHPNRSTDPIRFIGYSLASMKALSDGSSITDAFALAGGENEFFVVAKLRSGEPLHGLDILPRSAEIVWRGSNELAQRFRCAA
jgi:hypothetical protein